VVNGPEFVRGVEEDVTALAVGVVAKQVEQRDGFEQGFFVGGEIEVVMVGIVLDVLLERAGAERAVAQNGEGDEAKPQRLADEVRGHLAQGEGGVFKVPERLLAFARFVHGLKVFTVMANVHEEGVVGAEHELALEFDLAVLKRALDVLAGGHGGNFTAKSASGTCGVQSAIWESGGSASAAWKDWGLALISK